MARTYQLTALPYNISSRRLQETLSQKNLPKYRHNTNWNLAFAWGEGKQHYLASTQVYWGRRRAYKGLSRALSTCSLVQVQILGTEPGLA